MTGLTTCERTYLDNIRNSLSQLAQFLAEHQFDYERASVKQWYEHLSSIKEIQGNTNNGVSFIACLLAKRYLLSKLPMIPFDSALKPQGAPGLDIDERTIQGQRVVGEIKTTNPYKANDLGAEQKRMFEKDFDKLNRVSADFKFFFVTDVRSFEIVRRRYAACIPGVTVVLLTTGEEFIP